MSRRWCGLLIAVLCFAPAPGVTAWGDQGHRLTALIAWNRMSPPARAEVTRLLGGREDFVTASTWADHIRIERPGTRNWHSVDIPFEASTYVQERDCRPSPSGDCAIEAFVRSRAGLLNPRLPEQRGEWLKFLIHIVGDLHQPLHTIDRGDQAGNLVRVFVRGKTTSLHAAWDNDFIQQEKYTDDQSAEQLLRRYGAKVTTFLGPDAAIRWALEAHELGRRAYSYAGSSGIYAQKGDFGVQQGPPRTIPIELSPNYVVTSTAIVEEQLARAGVRLAALLNEILR
jgi:nuclease S1